MRKPLPWILLLGSILLSYAGATAQTQTPEKDSATVFTLVERMPSFPGGIPALGTFLKRNLRMPKAAIDHRISGTVYVSFVVGKDGRVREASVPKGIGYGCDEEALRVVEKMPRWKPGIQEGKRVAVRFALPITFSNP